jgi:Flp pilus assembly protein TadB
VFRPVLSELRVSSSADNAGQWSYDQSEACQQGRQRSAPSTWRCSVLIVGIICLVLGFVLGISILWTIGIIILVIGAILWILGAIGRPVGGRKHWF